MPASPPNPPSDAGLAAALRQRIADAHRRIEDTGAARAMLAATIGRGRYAALVGDLLAVQRAFEERLSAVGCPLSLDPALILRSHALANDAAALGAGADATSPAAQALAMRLRSAGSAELIGAAYVVAGSCMGSLLLRPRLAQALGVPDEPGHGIDHHRFEAAELARRWAALRARIDGLALDAAGVAGALRGAAMMMEGLLGVYAAEARPA